MVGSRWAWLLFVMQLCAILFLAAEGKKVFRTRNTMKEKLIYYPYTRKGHIKTIYSLCCLTDEDQQLMENAPTSPKHGGPCNMKKTIRTKSQERKETCRSAFRSDRDLPEYCFPQREVLRIVKGVNKSRRGLSREARAVGSSSSP